MLQQNDTAIVLVDVQGKLARLMHESEAFIHNIRIVLQAGQILGLPIVWAEQIPDKLGATVPEIAELLSDERPIAKTSFSCAGNTEFNSALQATGRKQVLLVGIEAHICVYQTSIELLGQGIGVHVVTDAVASRQPENKAIGLQRVSSAGAQLTSTEMCLFEMLKAAESDEFRQIVRLLK